MDASVTRHEFVAIFVIVHLIHWQATVGHDLCHFISKMKKNRISVTYPRDDP